MDDVKRILLNEVSQAIAAVGAAQESSKNVALSPEANARLERVREDLVAVLDEALALSKGQDE